MGTILAQVQVQEHQQEEATEGEEDQEGLHAVSATTAREQGTCSIVYSFIVPI